jgi:hypothetical protein
MNSLLLLLALSLGGGPPCDSDLFHAHHGAGGPPPRGGSASRHYYHFWAFHGPTWQQWYNYDYYRQFDYPWNDPRRREPPPLDWMQGPTRIRAIVGPPPPWLPTEFVPVQEVAPPAESIEIIAPTSAAAEPGRLRLLPETLKPHDGGQTRLTR